MQEADEHRRIAQRRKCAADITDEENEEDHDVHVVEPCQIRANERPHENDGGAGGADNACHDGAKREDGDVDQRRAAEISGDQDAAGDDIKGEQENDEAEEVRQHDVHERRRRARRAVDGGERRDSERAPDESELAVVVVPEP